MKTQVHRVEYFALTLNDRPGEGAELGRKLAEEGVKLAAFSAFPLANGKSQIDLVPEHTEDLTRALRKLGMSVPSPKAAFLIEGQDAIAGLTDAMRKLGEGGVNVRAAYGITGDNGRYGTLLWVAPGDVSKAVRLLSATARETHHV